MNELLELLKEQKYIDAIFLTKNMLQNDQDNAELWYILFLAENEDYINTDFENIKNEMAFNKALSLDKKEIYITEYNFYKAISKIGLHRLFRCAQKNYINHVRKYLDDTNNFNYNFTSLEIEAICKQIGYMELQSEFRSTMDLFYVLLNVLHLKTNSEIIKRTLDSIAERCIEEHTIFEPIYHSSLKLLPNKISNIAEFYWWCGQKNKLIQAVDIPIAEVCLIDGKWEKVIDTFRYIDYVSYEYVLMFLASMHFHSMDEVFDKLITIDLLENKYFNKLYFKPDFDTYNDYIKRVYQHNQKCIKYNNAITSYQKDDSYNYLKTISNFFDAKKYINLYKETKYKKAIELFNLKNYSEAISTFNLIPEYKDSKQYINTSRIKLNEIEQLKLRKQKTKKTIIIISVIIIIVLGILLLL